MPAPDPVRIRVKLHLTEENLEQRLAEFAHQSRSAHLTRTWSALIDRVPALAPASEETTGKRTYRGQEIPDSFTSAAEEDGARAARKKKVIYRGQVIG
ncbi:hypothetical protein [Marinobacter salicampi]|uniref:hypothetical protein n=1 Tax=Marinobacter salicampi TaxID=435907 RepID=UPI0030FE7BF6